MANQEMDIGEVIVQPEPYWLHQVGPVGSLVNSCLFMVIRLEPQEIKCADLCSSLDWFGLPLGKAHEFVSVYRKFISAK